MKKTYIIPYVSSIKILDEKPIATSGVGSNNGITYGGVDESGTIEPSVKENTFDFEWE